MDIKIQAIKFDVSEKLNDFIIKKVSKLSKFSEEIGKVEVSLTSRVPRGMDDANRKPGQSTSHHRTSTQLTDQACL